MNKDFSVPNSIKNLGRYPFNTYFSINTMLILFQGNKNSFINNRIQWHLRVNIKETCDDTVEYLDSGCSCEKLPMIKLRSKHTHMHTHSNTNESVHQWWSLKKLYGPGQCQFRGLILHFGVTQRPEGRLGKRCWDFPVHFFAAPWEVIISKQKVFKKQRETNKNGQEIASKKKKTT